MLLCTKGISPHCGSELWAGFNSVKGKTVANVLQKKPNHKTGTGGELYICLTISFLTLGEAQCDTVIVVKLVTETEK